MKNFRDNLHSAFFMAFSEKVIPNGEKDVKPDEKLKKMVQEKLDAMKKPGDEQEKQQEKKDTIKKSKESQGVVQESVTQENFPNIEGNLMK